MEEEEKEEEVVTEKEMKKSKSWGRRSTRAKKYISYRYVSLSARFTQSYVRKIHTTFSLSWLSLHDLYSFLSDLMSLMKQSKRQLRKTSKRQKVEVGEHFFYHVDI